MLFSCLRGESVTPLRRCYGDDFLIDETLWNGYVEDGRPFLCEGKSGKVSFRLLHVFEIREGRITASRSGPIWQPFTNNSAARLADLGSFSWVAPRASRAGGLARSGRQRQ